MHIFFHQLMFLIERLLTQSLGKVYLELVLLSRFAMKWTMSFYSGSDSKRKNEPWILTGSDSKKEKWTMSFDFGSDSKNEPRVLTLIVTQKRKNEP